MKLYKYLVGLVSCMALTACNDWLDLQPQDTTDEDQLFETGDGYRNALNGIYKQMSTSSMYGKELTWGALDAMAQYYSPQNGISEEDFSKYKYTSSDIYPTVQSVWTTAYNCIANCNNLIQRTAQAPARLFTKGEEEKDLIQGEALALRAILHFDILRLFAPGPKRDDGKKYVPYVDSYPITFQEYISNADFLDKVIDDLKKAKELVGKFDIPRVQWMITEVRFEGNSQQITDVEAPDELFFAYRGYRMNYYAICGMLARVYLYAGMYQEAFNETEEVVNAEFYADSKVFEFTTVNDGNTKMYDELLFCLSNQKLIDDYANYTSSYTLALAGSPLYMWFDSDTQDSRYAWVDQDASYNYVSAKYLTADGVDFQYAKDMIPMIRLGEMYLIRAECYAKKLGTKAQALNELATLRRGYNCTSENVDTEGEDWFETAIINEARREFMQEGQLFFYYKRLDVFPTYEFEADDFKWPYPENEIL